MRTLLSKLMMGLIFVFTARLLLGQPPIHPAVSQDSLKPGTTFRDSGTGLGAGRRGGLAKKHNCGVALSMLTKVLDRRVFAKLICPVCQLQIAGHEHVYYNRNIIHKACYYRRSQEAPATM